MAISCSKPISLHTITEAALVLPEAIIGPKGLSKRILEKGISWQTPTPGDEVEVHYSVSLQGAEYFDSSRDKGTPFRFKLGQGEVIKGWDEGIATMRKNERAIFTIPPELGYGEIGSPPLVPPNSTLVFDVQLISWYPIRDISGDGGIIKKIISEGKGWATPNESDEVFVNYVAECENGVVISKSDEEGLEFSLISGHLCPAMSKAVKTMRKGEKAELSVKFSYGLIYCEDETSKIDDLVPTCPNLIIHLELVNWRTVVDITGDKNILKKITKNGEAFDHPNEGSLVKEKIHGGLDRAVMTMKKGEEAIVKISADFLNFAAPMVYEIKLIDFETKKPFWKMDPQERISECETNKNDGNILFKDGKFELASNKYDKAAKYVEYNHSFSDEQKNQANSLRLSCYLNEAACKLKIGEYKEVTKLCTKVLELDPYNVKALFRRSQAYMGTSDLEKAEEDIKRALSIDPNNRDVKIKHKELKDQRREYTKHEAKIFSTMISRIS
ncbi:PREDICTED: 70 kDa peptidyl-prolyl isomerase-like isoform X2 [Erythranthe guttata]|uniref:70 kDa peptidyl-prolyl isomerase-like isoform X2 n=1 Tax=Erythranthe guttata TaxID=4155 RepID=UPI00064E0BDC|nr:PREDICTED: 70 kDa peptidyl-prolyl isomerase-like isoform X2 [Erythranthe guttata]|eukprot:XP_012857389.1 PREDICTED: 70 kDa peptidyl-prolyl isomerase-like isoform X2 [Erythranthe guttata]